MYILLDLTSPRIDYLGPPRTPFSEVPGFDIWYLPRSPINISSQIYVLGELDND